MKQVKLFFALLLSLVMVMSLAACGDDNGGGDADAEETVKIGVITYDTTDDQTKNFMAYYESLGEELGVEFMISESLADAEGELNFIADCASAGCIGIVGYYNESLEEAALAAADYGMYYWGGFGGNEEAYDAVKANEYYVGGYTLGDAEYNAGYEMGKALVEQGCTKIVYNNGGADFGVAMFVDRQQGFLDALAEANLEPVYTVKGWPDADTFASQQTEALGMDIDAIASSFSAAVWFQPLATTGKMGSVKLATVGIVGDTYHDFFNSGDMSVLVYDCEEVLFGQAVPAILNAYYGDRDVISDEDGNAMLFPANRFVITTADEYNAIYEAHAAGTYMVTIDQVKSVIKHYNEEATAQDFADLYDLTLEEVMAE
jgi:hypothetical protein